MSDVHYCSYEWYDGSDAPYSYWNKPPGQLQKRYIVVSYEDKRINVKEPVNVVVPVEVINIETSRGIKVGGVLNFAVRKVALRGLVQNIPEKITIDLTNLGIGETVHGSDLVLPNGVELGLHQAELAFATIGGKMAEEADNKPAAAAAAAAPAAAPAKK